MPEKPTNNRSGSAGAERKLLRLAEAVINGEATEAEVAELDALLAEDASARTLYLDLIDVHAGLKRKYLSPAMDAEEESYEPVVEESTRWPAKHVLRSAWGPALLALAASLLVAVWLSQPEAPSNEPLVASTPGHEASVNGVAVLSRAVDVVWSKQAERHREGSPLPAGLLAIDSGLIQVDFYCGAVAVLEGPAQIELRSPDRAALVAGKLRTRVPTRARGFTVTTSSGDVVDLGTEFAIEAPRDGRPGELHVIDGEVRFHPNAYGETKVVSLRQGEALWLGGESADNPPGDAGMRFVGPTEVETLARAEYDQRVARWAAHRERLLGDPHLIALYSYSPEPEWSRLFRNIAPGAGGDTHGSVVGAEWVAGRWPGTRALRFGNPSHRVSVSVPGVFESLSLSIWLAVDRFHPTNRVALLHPELEQDRALFWTLDRVPNGAVLHFAETVAPNGNAYRNHYSSGGQGMFNNDVGRWVHLVVTYDRDRRLVSHYRDGRLVGSRPIEQARQLSIGAADLGNWPYKDWAKGTQFEMRNLVGRIDEFAALGRALSAADVAEMYEAGAP
ncbi:MAG: LamG-like jellyroll fold domain-containing protein [Planctomycetota bacterium]